MAINVGQSHTTTGAKTAIPLSRHNRPQYTVDIDIGGGGDVTVEATIDPLNQAGVTPTWRALPALTNVTADSFTKIENTPLEAIRINITSVTNTIRFRVMQND